MKLLTSFLLLLTLSISFSASAQFDDDTENDSPLMKAVRANNLALVKKLVAEGAEINEDSDHGWNDVPVDVAVKNNYQAIALFLLEKGASSRQYFYTAVERGNLEFTKKLMSYGYRDSEAVLAAVESNNAELVEYLIGEGLPVNFEQKRRTGLFRKEYVSPLNAAIYQRNNRMILALVKGGAPIGEAFEYACGLTDTQLGTQLLGLKVELDKLHLIAVGENNLVLARKALQLGANPMALNNDGQNALHIAVSKGTQQSMDYAIKECNIPITAKTGSGENCLMLSAKANNFTVFTTLLQQGVFGLEETDDLGSTVLFYAVESKNPEIVRLLLTKNANINHQNKSESITPVMLALLMNESDTYHLFIEKAIDYKLRDSRGTDLLGYYMKQSILNVSEIEFLVNKGCDPKGLDAEGKNMAYHAVRLGNVELLNKLKLWNASLDPMDANRNWPHSYSVRSEVIQFIITNGADPNRLSTNGDSYLETAFNGKDIQLFAFLLRSGANPNLDNGQSHPFIFTLLDDRYLEYLKLMIEYKADVNVKDTWGDNLLEKALEKGVSCTGVVSLLRASGAKTKKEWAEFEVQRLKEMQTLPVLVQNGDLNGVLALLNKYPDIKLNKDQMNTLIRPAIQQENMAMIERLFAHGMLPTTTVNFEQQTLAHLAVQEGKLNLLRLFVNKGANALATDVYDKQPIDYAKDKEIKTYLKELEKKKK